MASPGSNRIGGARPSGGGGVKNLLAMFEKSSSSPAAASSGSSGPGSAPSRDISPTPKPLSKVRTSFVAITGSNGQMMGLQRISAPPSPVVTTDGGKFTPGFPEKDRVVQNKTTKKEGTEPVNGIFKAEEPKKDEAKGDPKKDIKKEIKEEPVEPVNGFPAPKQSLTVPPSPPDEVQIKEETPQRLLESILTKAEEEKKDTKAAKTEESKPRPATIKTGHPPKSPSKSGFNSPRSNKSSIKSPTMSGNTLSLPTSRPAAASPLPSPTFPRSPARGASTANAANSRRPTSASRASSKSRSTTAASASNTPTSATFDATNSNTTLSSAASKARQPAISKPKTAPPPKADQKPVQPKEPTKPAAMRGSAFGPTAASAAKLAADQAKQPTTRRPPSVASTVRQISPNGLRRPESNLGTRPTARKATKSPVRPATSAATRSNRTSTGSSASSTATGGGDFLSRMMRPTTASASKITDKKQVPTRQPSKRSGSVNSTGRRKEASSLPPPKVRLQKEDAQSEGSVAEGPAVQKPTNAEVEVVAVVVPEMAAPQLKESTAAVEELKEVSNELSIDTTTKKADDIDNQGSSIAGNEEDEGHTPTTTASSTTLVHEGDAQDEITAKVE